MKKNKYTYLSFMLMLATGSMDAQPFNNESFDFVDCLFTDLTGQLRTVTIPSQALNNAIEHGIAFDGSSIPGMTSITQSDLLLKLNMETFSPIALQKDHYKTARVFCDVFLDETTPYDGDARYLLKTTIKQAEAMGFIFHVGPELEFFIVDAQNETAPYDTQSYFMPDNDARIGSFKKELLATLLGEHILVEKIHHEVAHGQYEISLRYGDALMLADQIIIAKQIIRNIAEKYSLKATFMPKPYSGKNGSGMHIHFSLYNILDQCNAFYDSYDPFFLSQTAQHFIAGILKHIADYTLIFNQTINSYKRLYAVGFEAPTFICWGTKNRSALIRIPHINKNEPGSSRAELRSPDSLCNPYLAFATLLKLGLNGIKESITLPRPINKNTYMLSEKERKELFITHLPSTLETSFVYFETSKTAQQLVGSVIYEELVKIKKNEIQQYYSNITQWEKERYFAC